jgi:hypothetical protein
LITQLPEDREHGNHPRENSLRVITLLIFSTIELHVNEAAFKQFKIVEIQTIS